MTRIDEIRERAAKVTAGKWEYFADDTNLDDVRVCHTVEGSCVCCLALMGKHDDEGNPTGETVNQWRADADFIAHSREDIPYLLGEIDKLREQLSDPLTVRLPCKVGDTVYRPEALQYSWDIVSIIIYPDELLFIDDSENSFTADAIGKTVFLTREEAEKEAAE